jgi:hypothetical protein
VAGGEGYQTPCPTAPLSDSRVFLLLERSHSEHTFTLPSRSSAFGLIAS